MVINSKIGYVNWIKDAKTVYRIKYIPYTVGLGS